MKRVVLFVWALILAVGASACAHYPQEDGDRLATEVFALKTQLSALQKTVARMEKEAKTSGEKLTTVAAQIDELNQLARRNDAEFVAQLDSMMEQVARLRGLNERLEGLETKVNKLADEISIEQEKLATDKVKGDNQAADSAKRERLLADPRALVDEVVRLVNDQKLQDARRLLREFEKRAQKDRDLEKSLDEIQYLVAETYFAESNFQLAATEYNLVRKKFPKSKKVPEALFKMGLCFEKLSLPDDARLFYQTVIKEHKKEPAAKKAAERLSQLKKK